MEGNLNALTTIFTEFYYWVTVVFHVPDSRRVLHVRGRGASRRRNHMHTLMKNTMLIIPLVTVTFFLFGWWIYWAFPSGPGFMGGHGYLCRRRLTRTVVTEPWATHLGDRITGVFWAAFLLFSWTAASIVSGSVIERIRSTALSGCTRC